MAQPTVRTDTILDQLVEGKREALADRMANEPLSEVRERALSSRVPIPLAPALRGDRVRLIAEIKRASPTVGLLDSGFDPGARARSYLGGGAAAISILTEERRFLGRLDDVTTVRSALMPNASSTSVPLLRKDFLFDPYHLYEARAAGADAVLLIVAVLDQGALKDLILLAGQLELGALVEVHSEAEVYRAVEAGAVIVGINNRDLRSFVTTLDISEALCPLIPAETIVVSESGIRERSDVERLAGLGVDAILVGEALMRSGDIARDVRLLAGVRSQSRPAQPVRAPGQGELSSQAGTPGSTS